MKTLSHTAVRNNLAKVIDQVNEDHTPVIIARGVAGYFSRL